MLHDGLYEQVINKGLDSELAGADKLSQTAPIDTAEASKVLASMWPRWSSVGWTTSEITAAI